MTSFGIPRLLVNLNESDPMETIPCKCCNNCET